MYYINFRTNKKLSWPVTEVIDIPVNQRSRLIGPGGINIKRIMVNTGAQVCIALQYI